jgi:hypothetical protein
MQTTPQRDVTKTEKTKDQYRSHFFRLERIARVHIGVPRPELISPQQIAVTFLEKEANWAESTARAYRAALVFMFDEMDTTDASDAKSMIYHVSDDGMWRLEEKDKVKLERKRRKRSAPKTSAQKAKRLSLDDLDLLRGELFVSSSMYGKNTSEWFMAGILTGLRPTEWRDAELKLDEQGRKILLVQNAKNTNGRANGKERTLILEKMKDEDRQIIEDHMNTVSQYVFQSAFEDLYYNCRRLLCNISDRLWPRRIKHPTLYTARHMFSADMKTQFDSYGVAALLGHASTRTASSHYAPKWSSNGGGSMIEPSENDVASVVLKNEQKEKPRQEKRNQYIATLKEKRSHLSNKK